MSDAYYANEAWCPSCHVSHPPGTKTCLHCGGPVLPMRPTGMGTALRAGATPPVSAGPGAARPPEEEAPAQAKPLRFAIAALWLLLAVAGGIARSCAERG